MNFNAGVHHVPEIFEERVAALERQVANLLANCRSWNRKLWRVVREDHGMPTLVIDNVPVSLFDRIQSLAKAQQRTPVDVQRLPMQIGG